MGQIEGSKILTEAAEIIRTMGWSQGAHARDTENRPIRITHQDAAYFSVYGAVMKVMAREGLVGPAGDDLVLQGFEPMWSVLTREAVKLRRSYNGVHPLFDINDDPARTQAGMIDFLLDCADILKPLETAQTAEKGPNP